MKGKGNWVTKCISTNTWPLNLNHIVKCVDEMGLSVAQLQIKCCQNKVNQITLVISTRFYFEMTKFFLVVPQVSGKTLGELLTDNLWFLFRKKQTKKKRLSPRYFHADYSVGLLSLQGFGSVTAEHWLGNEYVYQLTSQRQYVLRVELTDWDGHQAFSLYDRFKIGSEKQNYR